MKNILVTLAFLPALATVANASDVYVQLDYTSNSGNFKDFKYSSPTVATFPGISHSGDYINMVDVSASSKTSSFAALTLGYEIMDNLNLTFAYRNLGKFTAKGDVTSTDPQFSNRKLQQKLTVETTILGFGANYNFDIMENLFIAPFLELANASVKAKGIQVGKGVFPSKKHNKMVLAYGLNIGYNITNSFSTLFGYYTANFGKVETAKSIANPPTGISANEQLQGKLSVTTMSLGLRYNFSL